MRSFTRRVFMIAMLAAAAVGCSNSSGPDDDDNSGGTVQGSFGHSGGLGIITFVATTVLPFKNSQGVGLIATDGSGRRIEFFVAASATGTYSVTGEGNQMSLDIGTQSWRNSSAATGTITITSITATTMAGTLSVVLQPIEVTGATGTMTVALTFSGTFGQT
jgi:hypothetical protein